MKAKAVRAQTRIEMLLTVRRAESLLVTLVIPLGILVFFSSVDAVNTTYKEPVDFLVPGVLKRLGSTPLSRAGLLSAKTLNVLALEVLQTTLIVLTGIALGWNPTGGLVVAVLLLLVGTIAFAGIGMLLAGTLRAEANLAVANGLFLVLLFLGGMAYPLAKLPDAIETFAKALPAAALSETVRAALTPGVGFPTGELVVLLVWAVAAPLAAIRWFRWEE